LHQEKFGNLPSLESATSEMTLDYGRRADFLHLEITIDETRHNRLTAAEIFEA
jgi:hypothetical protein